jgi:hypothetical protein
MWLLKQFCHHVLYWTEKWFSFAVIGTFMFPYLLRFEKAAPVTSDWCGFVFVQVLQRLSPLGRMIILAAALFSVHNHNPARFLFSQ